MDSAPCSNERLKNFYGYELIIIAVVARLYMRRIGNLGWSIHCNSTSNVI